MQLLMRIAMANASFVMTIKRLPGVIMSPTNSTLGTANCMCSGSLACQDASQYYTVAIEDEIMLLSIDILVSHSTCCISHQRRMCLNVCSTQLCPVKA